MTLETNCFFHDRRCDWHLTLRHEIKTERRNHSAAWVTCGHYVCTAAQIGDALALKLAWERNEVKSSRDFITDRLLISVQRKKELHSCCFYYHRWLNTPLHKDRHIWSLPDMCAWKTKALAPNFFHIGGHKQPTLTLVCQTSETLSGKISLTPHSIMRYLLDLLCWWATVLIFFVSLGSLSFVFGLFLFMSYFPSPSECLSVFPVHGFLFG